MDPSVAFLEHLPLIEQIITSVCRGRRMNAADTEEFESYAKLRLIDNDYAIMGKFQGRSSFGTFLTTVISRFLNDYRDHEWGKWRNSAEAKRLGPLAMELERLLNRDMRSIDECCIELAAHYPGTTRSTLEELAARFPVRRRRRIVSLDETGEPQVADRSEDLEKAQIAAVISSVVSKFIAAIPKEDQLIFQLRFENDMPVPQIAHGLHQDVQSLYRRLRKHFADLRTEIEKAGIGRADAARFTDPEGSLLDFHLKTEDRCPSNEEDPEGAPEESA